MNEEIIKIIDKAKEEKATFIDLGNCGLKEYLPEELFDKYFIEYLESLSLGKKYRDKDGEYVVSQNKGGQNCFFGEDLRSLSKLKKLSKLEIAFDDENIGSINSMHFIKDCHGLKEVDFSGNQISLIEGLNNNLEIIYLNNNYVQDLEPIVEFLKGIENPLKIIATKKGDLQHEKVLNVFGNPIKNPPLEVVQQGNDVIFKYFIKLSKWNNIFKGSISNRQDLWIITRVSTIVESNYLFEKNVELLSELWDNEFKFIQLEKYRECENSFGFSKGKLLSFIKEYPVKIIITKEMTKQELDVFVRDLYFFNTKNYKKNNIRYISHTFEKGLPSFSLTADLTIDHRCTVLVEFVIPKYVRDGIFHNYIFNPLLKAADEMFIGSLAKTEPALYLERGYDFFNLKRYTHAFDDFDTILELFPSCYSGYRYRGYIYLINGEYENAIEDFSNAIKIKRDYDEILFFRGIAHYLSDNFDLAIIDLNEAINIKPKDIIYLFHRAILQIHLKNYLDAENDFSKCLNLEKSNFPGMVGMSLLNYYKKNENEAISWMNRAIQTDSKLNKGKSAFEELKEKDYFFRDEIESALEKIYELIGVRW